MTEDVVITVNPWCPYGTRTVGWFGPISAERTILGKSWEEGIEEVLEEAKEKARALGGNAVVGLEIECDPYRSDGGHIFLQGNVARCTALFPDYAVAP